MGPQLSGSPSVLRDLSRAIHSAQCTSEHEAAAADGEQKTGRQRKLANVYKEESQTV